MKIKKNKEKKSSNSSDTALPSWMTRGSTKIKEAQKKMRESAPKFVPELWFQDGEVKMVRLVSSEPIAHIYQYSVPMGGRRFQKCTRPGPDQKDAFADAGLEPQFRVIYEVIDRNGYVDKKTKQRVKNVRRFWNVSGKMFEQLSRIREKKQGLTGFDIEVTRSGSGTSTTYTLLPEDPSPMPKASTPEPLSKQFEKFYAPLPYDRQKVLAARLTKKDESEDSEEESE